MEIIVKKRCVIGEGPIYNEQLNSVFFVDAPENKMYILDLIINRLTEKKVEKRCYAIAFGKKNEMIVSRDDGVFRLDNGTETPLYDMSKHSIINANDMKVGPDGRIYVGTVSGLKKCVSDNIDGKLYSIDKFGEVKILLDNLCVSNGLEWSMDEKRFYHTDSATGFIKEYDFDKQSGSITPTGRKVFVPGVDGFTIDKKDRLVVTRWDDKTVSFIDIDTLKIVEEDPVPCANPASCCFAGVDMKSLIIVTASYDGIDENNVNAGHTFLQRRTIGGRKPYLFG